MALPAGVNPKHAAAMATPALTMYQSVILNAKDGNSIFASRFQVELVSIAYRCAKAIGCYVVASCSPANAETCRSLGADEVVEYRNRDVIKSLVVQGWRFSLVRDNVGSPDDLYHQCHLFTKDDTKFIQIAASVSVWCVS